MENKMVEAAVKALDSKKAVDIKVIEIRKLSIIADYFVICNGTNVTQINALADECEFQLEQSGFKLKHREGKSAGNWILLDFGDIIVHIYSREMRQFYDLEKFWRDGIEIDISDIIKGAD
ncbi:MAG: iojap-related protein [Clostridia bacterium]|jgi:ribosome-associated protein|nr:iojap-related protein [Clostridia bacterium]